MKNEPLVLCLTNTVAANFTANVLLAIGAKPAMIEEPSEAAELAAIADAVLINVGTVTAAQAEAMRAAVQVAIERRLPWLLDPVAVNALTFRRKLVQEFLSQKPTLIRGNLNEIKAIAGSVPTETVVLATGEIDRITGDFEPIEIKGGVKMLQLVTASGCAQGAIAAAFLGWGKSPVEAARLSSQLMKKAGEAAFIRSKSPGSFQMALLDELYNYSPIFRGSVPNFK